MQGLGQFRLTGQMRKPDQGMRVPSTPQQDPRRRQSRSIPKGGQVAPGYRGGLGRMR